MTAFARILSQKSDDFHDIEALNCLMIFSSLGLLASLLCLTGGIDIAAGLF